MAVYAIGDIHGCYDSLRRLLAQIKFNKRHDRLWLVGDVVNRGPESLKTLRWIKQHEDCINMVLGNHDLHLLMVRAGFAQLHEQDTIAEILAASDASSLSEWLRRQPLAHEESGWLMVHAGVLPQWDNRSIIRLATEVADVISGDRWPTLARHLYGNTPNRWDDALHGMDRWRVIVNALTRLRICTTRGEMDLTFKGSPEGIPAGYRPWFDVPHCRSQQTRIVCGHWAALGLFQRDDVLALDSGCLWGRQLSAVRLSDSTVFQVETIA